MSARLGWTLYIVSVLKSPSVPHTGARDIILYIYILEHVERMSALFASVLCAFRGVQKAGKRMALPTGILAGLSCSMPSFADFNAALQTYCHDMAFFCVFCFFLGGGYQHYGVFAVAYPCTVPCCVCTGHSRSREAAEGAGRA